MKALEDFKLGEVVPREYIPGIGGKGLVRVVKKVFFFADDEQEVVLEYGIGPRVK